MREIYIVLIKAHTGLGKVARALTGYPYSHIAVCFDKELTDFVTYSRRRHYVPMDAGFMHEYRDYYAFGTHDSFDVKVFCLPIEECAYEAIRQFVFLCENDKEQMFNLFSMMTMPLLHGFLIYKTHNCMSFTAKILQLSGIIEMTRPYYRYSVKDMDELLRPYVFYEGELCRFPSAGYEQYMKKPRPGEKMRIMFWVLGELSRRMFFERNRIKTMVSEDE